MDALKARGEEVVASLQSKAKPSFTEQLQILYILDLAGQPSVPDFFAWAMQLGTVVIGVLRVELPPNSSDPVITARADLHYIRLAQWICLRLNTEHIHQAALDAARRAFTRGTRCPNGWQNASKVSGHLDTAMRRANWTLLAQHNAYEEIRFASSCDSAFRGVVARSSKSKQSVIDTVLDDVGSPGQARTLLRQHVEPSVDAHSIHGGDRFAPSCNSSSSACNTTGMFVFHGGSDGRRREPSFDFSFPIANHVATNDAVASPSKFSDSGQRPFDYQSFHASGQSPYTPNRHNAPSIATPGLSFTPSPQGQFLASPMKHLGGYARPSWRDPEQVQPGQESVGYYGQSREAYPTQDPSFVLTGGSYRYETEPHTTGSPHTHPSTFDPSLAGMQMESVKDGYPLKQPALDFSMPGVSAWSNQPPTSGVMSY